MKYLVDIKGLDRPVSVTAAITRPLVPFAGICNNMQPIMYIHFICCITLCILTVLCNESI